MRILLATTSSMAIIAAAALLSGAGRPETPDEAARATAITLFKSLDEDQKKLALKDFDDKDRKA